MQGFRIALRSLFTHPVRTILAMLGVLLGALSLTAVLHITQAMVEKTNIEIQQLGPNLMQAVAGQPRFMRSGEARATGNLTTFTLEDAQVILSQLPEVINGTPFCQRTLSVRVGGRKITSRLLGAWPNYMQVRALTLLEGRFYNQEEEDTQALVCVLGYTIAERLFNKAEDAVGQQVLLYNAPVTVIGVIAEKGQDISGTSMDEVIYTPLSTYMRRLSNQDWIAGVYINLQSTKNPEFFENQVKDTITQILRERHLLGSQEKDDFFVFSSRDASKLQTDALNLVWTLGMLSSGISFAVGALGILSIMTLLVRSRRLEIGIRRAVGANKQTIIRQFLMESALMAGTGGFTGVLLALGIVTLAYKIGNLPYLYNFWLLFGACVASVIIGIIAGAYPAWQASRVEVLEVLRNPE